jgi:hypothetical protein
MTDAPNEQHSERLSRAFDAVENWRELTSSSPLRCRPGSVLREDDRANPSYPVSVPAWIAIVQSVEHLDAIRLLFQGTGALFPSAYFSMARPALLGACRAVWILSPGQREERQRRAWLCRKEEADGVIGMTSDILTNQRFNTLPNASELRTTAEKSKASAKVIDDDLIALLKARGSRTRIDLTKMVEQAARHVFGTHPDPFLESGVLFNWRTSSGDAHALSWQMQLQLQLRNPDPLTKTDESEPGYRTEFWTSSVSDLMQNVCGITLILSEALDLFQELS